MSAAVRSVDWDLIEKDYRAGIKTVRQLAKEFGVSHTAIQKRASKFGWVQDLTEKIQVAAQMKVATEMVAKTVAVETSLSDAQTTKAYSDIVAGVDLVNRSDLQLAIDTQRTLMIELAEMSRPEFREDLERLGEILDKSREDESGRVVKDKLNETYMYIISLAGRVKMAKDISSAYGVYIPMQRKTFGLDQEKKNTSVIEDMLLQVGRLG